MRGGALVRAPAGMEKQRLHGGGRRHGRPMLTLCIASCAVVQGARTTGKQPAATVARERRRLDYDECGVSRPLTSLIYP